MAARLRRSLSLETEKNGGTMRRFLYAVLLMMTATTLQLFGQAQTTGRIVGHVTDDAGKPIAGATITVTNTQLQLERTATTGVNGDFTLALLPTGPYVVTVASSGKQPGVFNVRVGIGENVPINASLAAGEVVTETMTVTAAATPLETTAIGDNFNYDHEVERLPVQDRTLENVALLAPNMSFGPTPGTITIAGAPSFDTTVLLDGAEISDPYFGGAPIVYIEDAIEELQVLTSGVSARYGRFQGGILSAITKSGSNQFEGTVRAEMSSQKWNAQTPFKEKQSSDITKDYQGTLGGPIVRDRLWFFGGGRTIPTTNSINTTAYTHESVTQTRNEDRWQLKLRGALTANHVIDASYLSYESEGTNRFGLTAGNAAATTTRLDPRKVTTVGYQGVFNANTFLEVQAMNKDVSIAEGGDPSKGDPFIDYNTVTVFNNGWWDVNDPSIRNAKTGALNLTRTLDSQRYGSHTFEAGLQRVASTTGGENRQSSTGLNFLALNSDLPFFAGDQNGQTVYNVVNGESYRWVAIPLGGEQKLTDTSFYAQDAWNLNRFRFDLGIRHDSYEGEAPLPQYSLDFAGWAPRLGITYDVTPDWQVQATYGRYISRFNDSVANKSTGIASGPRIEQVYIGPTLQNATAAQISAILRDESKWGTVTGYVDPTQPTTYQATHIRAPYADDINFSVRHALPRSTGSVVLSYIHRDYKQLLESYTGGACDYGVDFGQQCPAANISNVFTPSGDLLAQVDTTVWANDSRAKRRYQALTALWDYRPSARWQFGGNYTFAKTKGNYEGEGGNTPASGSIFGDYEKSLDIAAAAPDGYTDDDIRHRFIATGAYNMTMRSAGALSVGSVFSYRSGLPFSLIGAVPYGHTDGYLADDVNQYNYYFGPNGEATNHARGTQRFDGYWSLDLAGRYQTPSILGVHPFFKASVLNVTNNHALIKYQTSGRAVFETDANGNSQVAHWAPRGNCGLDDKPSTTCTLFGHIRNQNDYQLPRTFQFSLGVQF